MRVLIACEFSGVVREAFRRKGHDAWSCDLLDTDTPGAHIKGCVMDILNDNWDLMIAHPPCTHLAASGARWFGNKKEEQKAAIEFAEALWGAPIPCVALENPIGVLSTKSSLGKATQIVQPWQFGHGETKATCLWIKNLPRLLPTKIVSGRESRIHRMPESPDRWKKRSITYKGIADAMAEQWGNSQPPASEGKHE